MKVISGKVVHGKKRGRAMGFPTANVRLKNMFSPGIYISLFKMGNRRYPAVTFIGNATTFDERDVFCETFVLDFDKTIYGRYVKVMLLEKIRDNEKFSGVEKLVLQMKNDVKIARAYFGI